VKLQYPYNKYWQTALQKKVDNFIHSARYLLYKSSSELDSITGVLQPSTKAWTQQLYPNSQRTYDNYVTYDMGVRQSSW
jgi:hypothetical protein